MTAFSGPTLALAGMGIVFLVLGCVSLFIALLPHLLSVWDRVFPAAAEQDQDEARVEVARRNTLPGEAVLVAAMAAAIVHQDPAIAGQLGMRTRTGKGK
ncbi:MAG: OadG family protein [Desulfovibrionaceae bacterium]